MADGNRTDVLIDLITLRIPVADAIPRVRALPWDSSEQLVTFDRPAATSALLRFRSGELTADDLESWANAIEGRDDVGFEPGYEELMGRFIFETANPVLSQPIDDEYVVLWLDRMAPPA